MTAKNNRTQAGVNMSKLPTARELIAKIIPNRANFEYCGQSGKINGGLLLDIEKAIESYTQAHTEGLMGRIAELETATNKALEILERRRQTTPGLGAPIIILKTALEDLKCK